MAPHLTEKKEVPPSQIETELTAIWDKHDGMRASLFNLIIITEKNQREEYFKQVSQKIIEKFPSRILFISLAADSVLKTTLSVLTLNEGDEAIACDLIEIEIGGSYTPRIPFLVLPHLLPDLPVYLLRADNVLEQLAPIMALERIADRIIFDSEAVCDLPRFASMILKHHKELDIGIADLNWARIEDWRALLADVFHSEERLNLLKSAESIHIHYNCYETPFYCHTKTQAIFLTLWLAHQLGWTLKEVESKKELTRFRFETLTIYLHPTTLREIPPGRLIQFKLETAHEDLLSLNRSLSHPSHVLIEQSTPRTCSIPIDYMLGQEVSGLSLIREICHKGTSQHLIDVLEELSKLDSFH